MSSYRPSILPDPFRCPDCDRECRAIVTYDPEMNERVAAWKCDECEAKFYREEDGGVSFRGVARRLSRRPFRR